MAISFDQFLRAIAAQESGGSNYRVVNSYGAVGKYQVLKSNIPSWSRAALGYSITWQKFRDTPALQERIVQHRMRGYWDKYGIRGAASAWYSGNPSLHMSTKAQPGGPSIKAYVDSVIKRAGGQPDKPVTTSGGGASSGGGGSAAAVKGRDELAEEYGFMEALFNSNKELKKLFNQAVAGGWSASKFQAELRDTKWWKTTSSTAREFLMLKYGDPATANQKLAQNRVKVEQLARQMGLSGASMSKANISSITLQYTMNGWTDAQLRADLGKRLVIWGGKRVGEAGEVQDKLSEYAYTMGINVTQHWLDVASKSIVSGAATEQDSQDSIRRMAKALFPTWGKQIDSGQTVMDIASPYFQSMSQILELPAGSINLFDKTIKSALQKKDPQTGANTVKPLWEFENDLRSDERWKATKNAQDSMMQVAHQVLADFGVKY